jgi:hypothetical protein
MTLEECAMISGSASGDNCAANDVATDFVRFCHRRRRTGWPELYDEMCAVARRGLYRGWGFAELAEHGVAFGLAEMPRLAALVSEVARQDAERPRRIVAAPLTVGIPAERAGSWEQQAEGAALGTAGS